MHSNALYRRINCASDQGHGWEPIRGQIASRFTAGRGNRDQMAVTDAVFRDPFLDVLWQAPNEGALQVFVAFEIGKCCFFFRKRDR